MSRERREQLVEVVILADAEAIGAVAADAIEALVRRKPSAVLGLATGSSPLPVYDELAQRHATTGLSFADCHGFALDEYVGLRPGHPESYREVVRREFTERVDIDPSRVHGPDGSAADVRAACAQYEDAIRSVGGIDLQILGIGTDGHVGFNEPGSSLTSRTRIKSLTEQTRADNARFFDGDVDQVPHHVLTQGLGTISDARHVILVAMGEGKAQAVHELVEGPVRAFCPASILQMHQHVTVLVDDAAADRLELGAYYRQSYRHKPAWQGI